jgi:tRNA (cmo5U34)-methyltransferase
MEHSVKHHLGIQAADYDRAIRTFIPGYETMLATIAWWLEFTVPKRARIVELGGGTGALALRVLEHLPDARLELLDIDPQMLEVARTRLAPFGSRVTFTQRSFTEALPPCDAVVASLALHHIPELAQKRAVYANIFSALAPSGIFLNGDATVAAGGIEHDGTFRLWADFLKSQGMTESQAQAHFASWAQEDTYRPLCEEFDALAAAGFARPQCFWKSGPITVYGGIKPAP